MKLSIFILLLFSFGCSSSQHNSSDIKIKLSDNHRSLQFNGLDKLIINEISRDSDNAVWQSLVAVYAMPADTDLKNYQPVQPGKYAVQDSTVIFTPDTPFVKGKTYFVRKYRLGKGISLAEYIKGQARVGNVQFIDLIFKP
ncbi:hypothetical protein ACFQZX_18195 [Mucilaginibacter litoreus]|uniref:Lipoprotein n=1 Tax=Mucilaginibacter litoreus TaxID=1048221 RepID=A0ABW3AYY5_9SPHI